MAVTYTTSMPCRKFTRNHGISCLSSVPSPLMHVHSYSHSASFPYYSDSPSGLPQPSPVCVGSCVHERVCEWVRERETERDGGWEDEQKMIRNLAMLLCISFSFPWNVYFLNSNACVLLKINSKRLLPLCTIYSSWKQVDNKQLSLFICHDIWILCILFSNASMSMFVLFCQCLKFKTDQAQDAKKMEKLNNLFFTLMSRGPDGTINLWMSFVSNFLCDLYYIKV